MCFCGSYTINFDQPGGTLFINQADNDHCFNLSLYSLYITHLSIFEFLATDVGYTHQSALLGIQVCVCVLEAFCGLFMVDSSALHTYS